MWKEISSIEAVSEATLHPQMEINLPYFSGESCEALGEEAITIFIGRPSGIMKEMFGTDLCFAGSEEIISQLSGSMSPLALEIEKQRISIYGMSAEGAKVLFTIDENTPIEKMKEIISLFKYYPDSVTFYLQVSTGEGSSPTCLQFEKKQVLIAEETLVKDWVAQL